MNAMSEQQETLWEKMNKAAFHPSTKAEVVAYYRDTFPARGSNSWKQTLVKDLAYLTGLKPKNLERRFDPSRINNAPRRKSEQQEYRDLAETIPPQPPEKGYHIEGTLFILYSECEECPIKGFDIIGKDAEAFTRDPNIQGVINVYNRVPYGKETNVVEPCLEETGASIRVSAIE